MPYAETDLPRLVTQQPYDISLQLVVPASEANIALGNFMTVLTLATPSNKTLATVRRSVSFWNTFVATHSAEFRLSSSLDRPGH
jgi:hypothetical protein